MSKSLGNVVDPRFVIEGGKNQKVSHVDWASNKLVLEFCQTIIFLSLKLPKQGFLSGLFTGGTCIWG